MLFLTLPINPNCFKHFVHVANFHSLRSKKQIEVFKEVVTSCIASRVVGTSLGEQMVGLWLKIREVHLCPNGHLIHINNSQTLPSYFCNPPCLLNSMILAICSTQSSITVCIIQSSAHHSLLPIHVNCCEMLLNCWTSSWTTRKTMPLLSAPWHRSTCFRDKRLMQKGQWRSSGSEMMPGAPKGDYHRPKGLAKDIIYNIAKQISCSCNMTLLLSYTVVVCRGP